MKGSGLRVSGKLEDSTLSNIAITKRGNYSGYLDEIMSKCKQMHLDEPRLGFQA